MPFLAGYTLRKKITIDNTNVDSTLSNHPTLIKFTNDTDIGSNIDSSGHYIRFTSSDGTTELDYERAYFNLSGSNATGDFWVEIPSISSSSTTDIYIYYKSSGGTDGEDITAVYTTEYKGVWHLYESGDHIGYDYLDSTSNNNDLRGGNGTSTAVPSRITTNAPVRYWQDFDTTDYLQSAASASLGIEGDLTVMWWSISDATTTSRIQVCIEGGTGETTAQNSLIFFYRYTGTQWRNIHEYGSGTNVNTTWSTTITTGTRYHWALVRDVSANQYTLYRNGVLVSNQSYSTDPTNAGSNSAFMIAARYGGSFNFDGKIGEVILTDDEKTAAYVKFYYNNVSQADNEQTYGAEEEDVPTGAVRINSLTLLGVAA